MSPKNQSPVRVLRIDTSPRQASVTRTLEDAVIARLQRHYGRLEVTIRDVSAGLEVVDEAWISANYTGESERDAAQRARLALSDELVDELIAADILVIGVPVFNFGIPAALKSWIDLVARVQRSFRYTDNGPEGLLGGRKAYLLFASGGVTVGSEMDFASGYMRHVLGFLGIRDVEIVAADGVALDADAAMDRAHAAIEALDPQRAAA